MKRRSLPDVLSDLELTSSKPRDPDFDTANAHGLNNAICKKSNKKIAGIEPSIEDVLSYILNNFDDGYCLLNTEGLQSMFPKKSVEDIRKWFEMKQSHFRISGGKSNSKRVYPCFVDVEPCLSYWSTATSICMKKECRKFHICKRMILGEIHNRNSCKQNHSFAVDTVMHLIKSNKLESYTDDQILVLLRNRLPFVFSKYQASSCEEGENHCSMLHICQGYVTKSCAKIEDICGLSHEAALTSNQAERISDEFHIPLANLQNLLLIKSVKQKAAVTNYKDAQFDWLKEAALCVDFLNDDCALNEKCILLHNLYKTPYLWQHKNIAGTSWTNFEKDTNENIEQAFCDPSKTKSGSNNPQFQINFKQVSKINKTHFTNGRFPVLFRRLSTRSSVINNKFAKPGVTHWKWYWEKSQNIWEEYKIWTTSQDIERSFLNRNQFDHGFTTEEFSYILSFNEMCQKNMDDNCLTERRVRRRPKFQSAIDLRLKKHSDVLCPSHWPKDVAEGSKIQVSNETLGKLEQNFKESIKKPVEVVDITEICNHNFFGRYKSKKKKMEREYSANEKLLYHGTSYDAVDAICFQNFDFRVCGKNATSYGKGTYFSTSASFSHKYSKPDSESCYYMFIAQVLVGRSTVGKSSYTRPPPLTAAGYDLYDSCVDNKSNPSMYIVFERDQCYPKYLVQYKLRRPLSYKSYPNANPSTWRHYLSPPMCVSTSTAAARTAPTTTSVSGIHRIQTSNPENLYSSQTSTSHSVSTLPYQHSSCHSKISNWNDNPSTCSCLPTPTPAQWFTAASMVPTTSSVSRLHRIQTCNARPSCSSQSLHATSASQTK